MRDRGFTLLELVPVSVLVFMVASLAGTIVTDAHRARETALHYSHQLHDARRALSSLENDLRTADSFRTTSTGIEVTVDNDTVEWHVEATKLVRNGRTLARAIAGLSVTRADGVFEIALSLASGRSKQTRPTPVLVSEVTARRMR